jgi:hypothetical protein
MLSLSKHGEGFFNGLMEMSPRDAAAGLSMEDKSDWRRAGLGSYAANHPDSFISPLG